MELTLEALEYLHDADLHSVEFDSSTPIRSVSFTATYHPKCGSKELDGRSIRVVANDITLLRAEVHGAMANREEIDCCATGVSAEAEQSIAKWIEAGGRRPAQVMRLVTHSGSFWEIMCESIAVTFVQHDATARTA
jgi:hypothetical protein